MTCPVCKAEVPIEQGFCPHCGSLIGPGFAQTSPARSTLWWLPLAIVGMLFLAAGSAAIYLWRSGALRKFAESVAQPYPSRSPRLPRRVKVEHGAVLTAAQLHGHNKVFFVPIGPQVIAPEELANHYIQKFDLDVKLLPEVPVDHSMPHRSEKNYLADGVMRMVINAYPELAEDPRATLIGLTNVDLYIRDDQFVTAYHGRADSRVGVVSSRGFDYESRGAEDAVKQRRDFQERRMLQMITKYIAVMHWGLHENNDPESVLRQPLEPDTGRDDLYESDLDPEATPAGRWDDECALLYFVYSYRTGKFTTENDSIGRCGSTRLPAAPGEEWVVVELTTGALGLREPEFQLPSTPPIEFTRGYVSNFPYDRVFGYGSDHYYDSVLTSEDGADMRKTSFRRMDVDYDGHYLIRTDPGKGFLRTMAYEGKDPLDRSFFHAKMTWHMPDDYDAITASNEVYSYLGCTGDQMCYFNGYRDSAGQELRFERDDHRDLLRLTPASGPGLSFQYDASRHINEVRSGDGHTYHYDYDSAGNLAQVRRPDGFVSQYGYDARHNVTSLRVVRRPGAPPQAVLIAEYDPQSRLTRLQIGDQPEYRIEYRTVGDTKKITITHAGFSTLISGEDCDCGEYHIYRRPVASAKAVLPAQPAH